jgi:hypothetical protein
MFVRRIYSAEAVDASSRFERRIKITNRLTGERYYRPYQFLPDSKDLGKSLREKVHEIHTSPLLEVNCLWYDESLKMLFFEVNRRNENGSTTSN